MSKFDFVFLIQLRYVDKDNSLAEVIKLQHDKLGEVSTDNISAIISGKSQHKVLLLLDGYDEYKTSTNKEIDEAIDKSIGNCFLLLTSRPGFVDEPTKTKFNGELVIEGLSAENIKEFSTRYLESEEQSTKMLQQAQQFGIHDLLRVPIILLMACAIFDEKGDLPKTKTHIIGSVFELSMDRTTLKENNFDVISSDIADLQSTLLVLGKSFMGGTSAKLQTTVIKQGNPYSCTFT